MQKIYKSRLQRMLPPQSHLGKTRRVQDHWRYSCPCREQSDEDEYGPQIATRATSMEFLNVDGPLTGLVAGKRLAVFKSSVEGQAAVGQDIQFILRDAFGRRIRGETVDSGEAPIQP